MVNYRLWIFLFLLNLFIANVYAQETLTITTYYPSPSGSYNELTAYSMKIGSGYAATPFEVNGLLVEGNVGIGTTAPEFRLTLDNDGGIIAKGTSGSGATLSTSGAGTRLIWYPRKAAFRAGQMNGNRWDDASIGSGSFATGVDTEASGSYSFAAGDATVASNSSSVAMGNSTLASGQFSTAMGRWTAARGLNTTAMGYGVTVDGDYSFGIGLEGAATTVTDPHTMAIMGGNVGIGTTSPNNLLQVADLINFDNGTNGTFLGYQAGNSNRIGGLRNSFIGYQAGYANTTGDFNTAVGYCALHDETTGRGNTVLGDDAGHNITSGLGNVLLGYRAGDNITTGDYNIIIGYGVDAPEPDRNRQINIGDVIYARGSRVGIGTTTPAATLDVNGTVSVGSGNIQIYRCPNDGGLNCSNADWVTIGCLGQLSTVTQCTNSCWQGGWQTYTLNCTATSLYVN